MAGVWRRSLGCVCVCVCAVSMCAAAGAQVSLQAAMVPRGAVVSRVAAAEVGTAPASVEDALQAMFVAADVVFAGEVMAVERGDSAVTMRFRVDDAVRGAVAGQTYTFREWAGLWMDTDRYRVGERRLMLLHAPSAAGFSSPVGLDGAVPIRGDGVAAFADLRWIAAHVAVTSSARLGPVRAMQAAGGVAMAASALQAHAAGVASSAVEASSAADVADGNASIDGAVVMDLLHAWQRNADAVR